MSTGYAVGRASNLVFCLTGQIFFEKILLQYLTTAQMCSILILLQIKAFQQKEKPLSEFLDIKPDLNFNPDQLTIASLVSNSSSDYPVLSMYAEFESSSDDQYSYPNAATCPDCDGGMIQYGRCVSCPSCGFEVCGI